VGDTVRSGETIVARLKQGPDTPDKETTTP
jgi:hypothetical protein